MKSQNRFIARGIELAAIGNPVEETRHSGSERLLRHKTNQRISDYGGYA